MFERASFFLFLLSLFVEKPVDDARTTCSVVRASMQRYALASHRGVCVRARVCRKQKCFNNEAKQQQKKKCLIQFRIHQDKR